MNTNHTNWYGQQITSLPTVIAFANGEKVNGFVGAIREDGVREFISKL